MRGKVISLIIAIILITNIVSPAIEGVKAATTNGWVYETNGWSNGWHYYENGISLKDKWLLYNGKWYHLNEFGVMNTGWFSDIHTLKWYYLDSSGVMQTGWVKVNSKWYYLDSSGAMQTGWVKVNSVWYFLESSGAMKTGWLYDDYYNKYYYLNSSGAMLASQWLTYDNVQFYLDNSGVMDKGWVEFDDYSNAHGIVASDVLTGKITDLPEDGRLFEFTGKDTTLDYRCHIKYNNRDILALCSDLRVSGVPVWEFDASLGNFLDEVNSFSIDWEEFDRDMAEIERNMAELHSDMEELQRNMAELQSKMDAINKDMISVGNNINDANQKLADFADFASSLNKVGTELAGVNIDVNIDDIIPFDPNSIPTKTLIFPLADMDLGNVNLLSYGVSNAELRDAVLNQQTASLVVDLIPVVGNVKSVGDLAAGHDLISGEDFSALDYTVVTLSVVVGGVGKIVGKTVGKSVDVIEDITKTMKVTVKTFDKMTPYEISKLNVDQLKSKSFLPEGWTFNNSPDFSRIHIRDKNAQYRIRVDPPDTVTTYTHIHIFDESGNALDINGKIVPNNSPAAHIPYSRQ